MLKRSRPVTPPPQPVLPLGPSSAEYHQRNAKRQRTIAPSLDGPSRGWAQPIRGVEFDDDDEEEDDWQQDENDGPALTDSRQVSSQYKASNSLLHDLHAEYQHRILFSSSTIPSRQSPAPVGLPSSLPQTHGLYSGKQAVPYLSDRPVMTEHNGQSHTNIGGQGWKNEVGMMEEQRVKQRYEETNKLLRSLFLGRRQESFSSSASP